MAQKKQTSKAQSFTHGMVSDSDPRFQIKGSYSDALNIRLTNEEGDTFTVENIEGNSIFVDLFAINNQNYQDNLGGILGTRPDIDGTNSDPLNYFSEIYMDENTTDSNGDVVGVNYPSFTNPAPPTAYQIHIGLTVGSIDGVVPFMDILGGTQADVSLEHESSIVGYTTFGNEMILIIVTRHNWAWQEDPILPPVAKTADRTKFLRIKYDKDMNVESIHDLMVCYSYEYDNYPDLNMDQDTPVKLEALVENECITRIYWTDNKNPLRTLNIGQEGKNQLPPESLDITPQMNPSQPVLANTLHGSLPVGSYQYVYKYVSSNGGESTFSPLSNMYHVSAESFGSSSQYHGSPKGILGTQGFDIIVDDIDEDFQFIELYALFYEELNLSPRVALVDRKHSQGLSSVKFSHITWNHEIDNGLEQILIESNTWDVCKDIAIKDNILFAANLKQKKNWISEKEWNVKVLRHRISDGMGHLTTDDPLVKHYDGSGVIQDGATNSDGQDINHGSLLTAANSGRPEVDYDGSEGTPSWTTIMETQRHKDSGGNLTVIIKQDLEYRYLIDKMTLGAESFDYASNTLGGCRVTFGLRDRVADETQNTNTSPYISAATAAESFQSDNITSNDTATNNTNNTGTIYQASMGIGGSKDPHISGDRRGYQRGEVYRFGVQIYDKTGAPGNVLWIGDIQMPEQSDPLRMLDTDRSNYSTLKETNSLVSGNFLTSHKFAQDHRLSYVYGHVVAPIDVEWFSGRLLYAHTNLDAYVNPDGTIQPQQYTNDQNLYNPLGVRKATTVHSNAWFDSPEGDIRYEHDDSHHLLDLYVNFEFIIPEDVRKKMSGFRVVRSERTESDKRIIQQGLLNQTAQYGEAGDRNKGYNENIDLSQEDNENLDDNPIFVNDNVSPIETEQPEYDTYLNGFLGLAENSHIAYYRAGGGTGTVTDGGHTAGTIYAFEEQEDQKHWIAGIQQDRAIPFPTENDWRGPGTFGRHHRHSAYFGSYDKQVIRHGPPQVDGNNTGNVNSADGLGSHAQISGSIFTLDSPDSSFGARPYIFRDGDRLRIDCVMKLTDNLRYNNEDGNWTSPWPGNSLPSFVGYPKHFFSHCSGPRSAGYATGHVIAEAYTPDQSWKSVSYDKKISDALKFCERRKTDSDYGILIGKYYCYDTYWGIGMEIDAGKTYADPSQYGNNSGWKPKMEYGYQLPISAAKEIGMGEVVPSGFFKKSKRVKDGKVDGFSNNTLGFVSTEEDRFTFGAVHTTVTQAGSEDPSAAGEYLSKKEDLTYDTMSTMQVGLRSILIEVNTDSNTARPTGGGGSGDTSYFKTDGTSFDNWFAPLNLSAIMESYSWLSRNTLGVLQGSGGGKINSFVKIIQNQGVLTSYREETNANDAKRSYIPFKYLCSIVRRVIPYGGYSKSAIQATRYIPCGNFHSVNANESGPEGHVSKVFGGDTFINLYSHQKTACPYMINSFARFQVFPVESYVNTDMRGGLHLNAGDTTIGEDATTAPFSNDWLYNGAYSQENTIKSGVMINEEQACDALDLPFEIAYSDTKIAGEPGDAFRVFPMNNFHDMEGQFGEINRIFNFKNEIYILQDEAFAKLLVNPISMISDDAGTNLFTGTGDTVENHIYISTKFGTRHSQSVATSEQAIYFVDSRYARLFKYDTDKLISLGDSLGQRSALNTLIKELNDLDSVKKTGRNYTSDNTLKFLGIQSVFDHKNKELIVTFHNSEIDNPASYIGSTLVFNEGVNAFSSYYSAVPSFWMVADPAIVSTGNEVSVTEYLDSGYTSSTLREGALKLWLWNNRPDNKKSVFFQEDDNALTPDPAYLEKVMNENAESAKVFDNGQIVMTPDVPGSSMPAFVEFLTENSSAQTINLNTARYREGILRFPLRTEGGTQGRMRGTWLKIKYTANTTEKFNIFAILAKYRKSYN